MSPYLVARIVLDGVRAYNDRQDIVLSDTAPKKNLVLFAQNGLGKSSIVDALEYFFSDDGVIERFGKINSDTKAGRESILHVDAATEGRTGRVELILRPPLEGLSRPVVSKASKISGPISLLRSFRVVNPLVRGHELRAFIEERTTQGRYVELAQWMGATRLTDLQADLRRLATTLRSELDQQRDCLRPSAAVHEITGHTIPQYSSDTVLQVIDVIVREIPNREIVIKSLSEGDEGYRRLRQLSVDVGDANRKDALDHLISLAQRLLREIDESHAAILARSTADAEARRLESTIISNELLVLQEASLQYLQSAADETCPICTTQFSESPAGSREYVLKRIQHAIERAGEYTAATKTAADASSRLSGLLDALRHGVEELVRMVPAVTMATLTEAERTLTGDIPDPLAVTPQDLDQIRDALSSVERRTAAFRANFELDAAERITRAADRVARLFELHRGVTEQERTCLRIESLIAATEASIDAASQATTRYVNDVIKELEDDVNDLYAGMLAGVGEIPRIRLEAGAALKDTRALAVLADFRPSVPGVKPQGYFSDSQLHMLALAMRLAAVRRFNANFPFIVLDDVISSFDVDRRTALAAVLRDKCQNLQILVLTCDDRFFRILKDQLPSREWSFKRIVRLDPNRGPQFEDHRIADDIIETKLAANQSAANDMRQLYEEWLNDVVRQFRLQLAVPPLSAPYDYSRQDMADALLAYLKKTKGFDLAAEGFSQADIDALKTASVLNFGSHGQANPNASPSVGDEHAWWDVFKRFRALFACPYCHGTKFQRSPGDEFPKCAKKNCAEKFTFDKRRAISRVG